MFILHEFNFLGSSTQISGIGQEFADGQGGIALASADVDLENANFVLFYMRFYMKEYLGGEDDVLIYAQAVS